MKIDYLIEKDDSSIIIVLLYRKKIKFNLKLVILTQLLKLE